jgi:hypothetical protein
MSKEAVMSFEDAFLAPAAMRYTGRAEKIVEVIRGD